MKKYVLMGWILLYCSISFSQVIYEEVKSTKLNVPRKVKIQLPRNYKENKDKTYPIILVLDGDYLFEPVAGNVDYYSYWEDMPESIVVGVLQGQGRYLDCAYSDDTNFPDENGQKFFEFLGMELLPYIAKKYRMADFVVGVGHDYTANFLNYYLFKEQPIFDGYLLLSPDFAPQSAKRIADRIPTIDSKLFYYMATGTNDIPKLQTSIKSLNDQLKELKSEKFQYSFDNFDGASHYSLVGRGIPNGLEKIFSLYRPISKEEYNNILLKTEIPLSQYLQERYSDIERLFGLKMPIRVNDYLAVANACEQRRQLESLREIGVMAQRQYPETVLGDYFLGIYYENTGNTRKAIKTFQGAYSKKEVDYITVDHMMDRAEKLRQQSGD